MKRIFSLLMAIIMLSGVMAVLPVPAMADEDTDTTVRRVVSVVYDDSGSMLENGGDYWAYANYAMQSFCTMLNAEDELYITYMYDEKNPTSEKINITTDKSVQEAIQTIAGHSNAGGTPFKAIEVAYNKLAELNDEAHKDKNTEYYLVIFTDGEMKDYSNNVDRTMSADEVKEKLVNVVRPDDKNDLEGGKKTLANGTFPRVLFFGIGDEAHYMMNDEANGIYTFEADNVSEIRSEMTKIASLTSGKAKASNVNQGSSNSIKVTTNFPVRNFVMFVQGSSAKYKEVKGQKFDIIQNVSVGFSEFPLKDMTALLQNPKYSAIANNKFDLSASSITVVPTNSDEMIPKGTYEIIFDGEVDAKNVEVFYEPAIELAVTVEHDGKKTEINNSTEFQEYFDVALRKNEYKITCEICEAGDRSKKYKLSDFENAKIDISMAEVDNNKNKIGDSKTSGGKPELSFTLSEKQTEIKVSANIDGYSPLEYYALFTPNPKIEISAVDTGSVSVKYKEIAKNSDVKLSFIVKKDGEQIMDEKELRELFKRFEVSVDGCEGNKSFTDGMITFTPNKAVKPEGVTDKFDVKVTCVIKNGTMGGEFKASKTFTVTVANYVVVSTDAKDKVKKTEFFGNDVGVSFYIQMFESTSEKTGVKLTKKEIEEYGGVDKFIELAPEGHATLNKNVKVMSDGTITVTPISDVEHKITFWNWWINWAYYFGLEGDDVTVNLHHNLGDGVATINVVGEDMGYMLLNVYLPLIIEIILLTLLIIWIFLVVTKPRYNKGATLFVGEIRYNPGSLTHTVRNFRPVKLEKFNKLKRGNGRLKFKRKADVVSANGIRIRADHGGRIICEMMFPWYRGKLEPADSDFTNLRTPKDVSEYVSKHKRLEVNEFATTEAIDGEFDRGIAPATSRAPKYIVIPDSGSGVSVVDGKKVIKSGKIFIYVNG